MADARRLAPLILLAGALVACSSSGGGTGATATPSATPTRTTAAATSSPTSSAARPSRPASRASTRPRASAAQRAFDAMTERERVGQLLMVDCPSTGVSGATSSAVTESHVGSVILDGTSQAGVQETQAVTSQLRGLAPKGVGLFISTDQEGGIVQRLQGPGFSSIPSADAQGETSPSTLRSNAKQWGGELLQAGVNVNLAPVLDTVPAGFGANPPIGDLNRQYGSTPGAVGAHGLAFARGMSDAGIAVTVKHFPGLGRTRGNTDLSSGVTDDVTTRHDAYLAPFAAAVEDGAPFVMMSTAIYARIDPDHPAAFSRTIVTGMLRGDLGFHGLVISDDIGASKQVSGLSPGERAVAFVAAGGDVVLTVDAGQAQEMTGALLARARSEASFKKQVDAAVLRVLRTKQQRGLLG